MNAHNIHLELVNYWQKVKMIFILLFSCDANIFLLVSIMEENDNAESVSAGWFGNLRGVTTP